ncbi:DnaJ (Hsp40), sub C, member 17 [Ciborinia camelliae]|nr:DnaJ (Hsp40), sub C, member 17 [Ciborinia camelliae]
MSAAAASRFIDSYPILSISPSASESEISKAWKRLALSLHPDKNPNQDTKERFQQLQDAYDAIKTARARRNHDAHRDQHLADLEAARLATEAAALVAKEARQARERWERDQKQRKQRGKLRKEKDAHRIQKEKKEKRERAKACMAAKEAQLVSDIIQTLRYRRLSPIKRALYRAAEQWNCRTPDLFEFKNRIHASYQARVGMYCEVRNGLIEMIIQQQHSIHHARGQTAPTQLPENEKLKQNQELRATFRTLRQETINYEKQQYEWRQSISAEALQIIGSRNPFLLGNNTPDCFEPARCFWESFAEISRPLPKDVGKVGMATSKLWYQALYGFVAKAAGFEVASTPTSESHDLDALRDLWRRQMGEGPWHGALGERQGTPVGDVEKEDICGRCCLTTSFGEHETVASRCGKCEMVVCETCRVELETLREFEEWVKEVGAYDGGRPECFYGPAGRGWIFDGETFVSEYNL